ncbi:hypothetical protein GCM10007971_27540 [Oceanobacillus indicireducens]|uniref:Uncharacterized protein n=1 Tax=Oceanobacillus indicireducens TaxID=1004261 RepID=A0A917Y1H5_9BACI|nr:hypothetical protein GCM10007971_27540 [Oceanobacillus indicireducens]
MTDRTVEMIITNVITNGRKLENKSIKNSVITPSGILKLLSASLTGIKKIITPNNEGMINFNKPDIETEYSSTSFFCALITITLQS